MIKKILHKFKKAEKTDLDPFLSDLEQIRANSDTLVLYGSPTEGNWLGIANATKGLYPETSLKAPQWFSHSTLTTSEQNLMIDEIRCLKFRKVLISGFAEYFFSWIDELHSDCEIEILYHGTISEWNEPRQQHFIQKLIQYGQTGKINRMGFVKKGLEDVFKKLYNIESFHQPLAHPVIPSTIQKLDLDRSKIHIGVFGADTFNKNLHNQVVHALMIDKAVVHVLDKDRFAYLNMDDRIVGHGTNLKREDFLSLLGSMDLNLYMSFNESWGLIKYESEALGVPCISLMELDYSNRIKSSLQ